MFLLRVWRSNARKYFLKLAVLQRVCHLCWVRLGPLFYQGGKKPDNPNDSCGGEMVDLEKQRGRPSGHQDVLNLERPPNSSSWPATGPTGMLCTQRLTRTHRSRVFAHNVLRPYFIPSIKYCPVFEDKQKADKLVCPPHDRRNIFSVILLEKHELDGKRAWRQTIWVWINLWCLS